MKKKVMALLMVVVMVFTLAGCGTKEKSPESKTVSEVLAIAEEANKDIKSVDANAFMNMKMSSGEESLEMDMNMKVSSFTDPIKAKVDMDMNAVGESMSGTFYMIEEDGKFYTYTNMLGAWTKQEMPQADFEKAVNGYDNKAYLDALASAQDNFKMSDVTEDGKELYKLEGTITGEAIKNLMESSSILDSLKSANIDVSLLDGMGDIKITSYFEKDTCRPIKITMDMKDLIEKVMEKAMEESGSKEKITVENCLMEMTYSNYNAATDFELPEEAANAVSAE